VAKRIGCKIWGCGWVYLERREEDINVVEGFI